MENCHINPPDDDSDPRDFCEHCGAHYTKPHLRGFACRTDIISHEGEPLRWDDLEEAEPLR